MRSPTSGGRATAATASVASSSVTRRTCDTTITLISSSSGGTSSADGASSGFDDHSKSPQETLILNEHYKRNYAAFWLLGMINNFHYCLVLSASDEMASSLNLKKYVALVAWANVFFGLFVRLLNAFVFYYWSYKLRVVLAGAQTLIGICVVSAAPFLGDSDSFRFVLLLLGIVAIGNGSSYGESVALGYLEQFPSRVVGGWSSGTGMSGVLAALIYLGLSAAGLGNATIFLLSAPLVLVYWAMFFFVLRVPVMNPVTGLYDARSNWRALTFQPLPRLVPTLANSSEVQRLLDDSGSGGGSGGGGAAAVGINTPPFSTAATSGGSAFSSATSLRTVNSLTGEEEARATGCQSTKHHYGGDNCESQPLAGSSQRFHPQPQDRGGCCRRRCCFAGIEGWWRTFKADVLPHVKRLHRLTLWNNINLMLVYIFEYAVQFVAPFSFPCDMVKNSDKFLISKSFVITQFCYQLGVLVSRSSLACFRIRRVVLLTIAQGINAVLWFVQARTLLISSDDDEDKELRLALLLFGWMIVVGFFGGASYVNVFFNILEATKSRGALEGSQSSTPLPSGGNSARSRVASAPTQPPSSSSSSAAAAPAGLSYAAAAATDDDPETVRQRLKLERQLSMNIGALYAVLGITGGSLVDVIFSNTLLTRSC